ncbi:MAG: hypothetical protein RLZZ08_374 [Pseudomonadota bacterium]|jgi:CubicO group peptidase (beta-lactamase class C family)
MSRHPLSSLAAASLPALLAGALLIGSLAGCSRDGPPPAPPLSDQAMAAVAQHPGVKRARLARAVDALFTADGIGETRAVVVMHDGQIVAERYGEGYGPKTRFLGWSMSKTVTGVMIGLLVSEGRLHPDNSPPIPRWQRSGDPRGEITLLQLLQMRSGLRHQENADPVYTSAEVRMLFLDGRDDMAGWAEAQPLEHEPGRRFEYSTPTGVILADIAARVLAPDGTPDERRHAVDSFLHDRLAGPLGMHSLIAEYDRAGTMIGGSMIWANARDWAKFGEFLRHGGAVAGAQIVPRGWIDTMRHPSPRAPDYGAMLWLNRPSGTDRKVLFPDDGPRSLFAAVGHLGQYVLVSPDQQLVVVRLGNTDDRQRAPLVEKLQQVVALFPKE